MKRLSILDIPASGGPTCRMCKHYRDTSTPDSYDDPGSESWDCENWGGIPEDQQDGVDEQDANTARQCPCFEINPGWNTPEREAPIEFIEPTEAQQQKWTYQDAVDRGWIDPETGELTDEFFQASDEAYDMSRGK